MVGKNVNITEPTYELELKENIGILKILFGQFLLFF